MSILPQPQRRLWDELRTVPTFWVLYGGTAIALHLGHRTSVDFDFFGSQHFDPDELYKTLPFLSDSEVLQKSPNTLTCRVNRGGSIHVSFFGVPEILPISPPHIAPGNGIKVASLLDLAGVKAAVVQKRAEARDYVDLDALIQRGRIDLPTALAAARKIFGQSFNPQITLKALCYFEDGSLPSLSSEIRNRLTDAVRKVDLDQLPVLDKT